MPVIELSGVPVLVLDADDDLVTARSIPQVLADAFNGGAATIAIPVDRLDPEFFELRSGVAGEIAQKVVNYGQRMVVVGQLPELATTSRSFSGFVLEGNRGDRHWFVASLGELAERLVARHRHTAGS
jgi:hypothetical protein